ncbi:MAG: hypothetical protein ABI053_06425 [Lacisediminihabitans sp.]
MPTIHRALCLIHAGRDAAAEVTLQIDIAVGKQVDPAPAICSEAIDILMDDGIGLFRTVYGESQPHSVR